MAGLRDVFGVHNPPPLLTYVDRAGLDDRIKHFLSTGRHLVLHGPSKQGKTALRKRALSDDSCIVIQCRNRPTLEQVYAEILADLGKGIPTTRESTKSREVSGGTEASAKGGIFGLFSGEAKAKGEGKAAWENVSTEQVTGIGPGNIKYIADAVYASGKRLVLEDFHYVPEEEKKNLANDLKALYELHVPVILVGAWEQQQLLPQYNGDLTGRVDEINVRWTDAELRAVLEKGETALNILFVRPIKDAMIHDASGNVGLLQRLAERLCMAAGVLGTQADDRAKQIRRQTLLDLARQEICKEEAARYRRFGWSVCEGFPNSNEATKRLYMYVIQVCVEAQDAELLAGLPIQQIEQRIQQLNSSVQAKAIRTALQQIDKLQSEKSIYPVIATYDPVNRVVNLADRELLFYRKYGGPNWPWEDTDE
jgi:hypothetical protein